MLDDPTCSAFDLQKTILCSRACIESRPIGMYESVSTIPRIERAVPLISPTCAFPYVRTCLHLSPRYLQYLARAARNRMQISECEQQTVLFYRGSSVAYPIYLNSEFHFMFMRSRVHALQYRAMRVRRFSSMPDWLCHRIERATGHNGNKSAAT